MDQVTTKTKEEILLANWEELNQDQRTLESVLREYPDMSLEVAIESLNMIP